MPPQDAPLAQSIGPLQQRADRGDRKAACRLAMELLRCDYVAYWAGSQANAGFDHEAELLREGKIAAADAAASRELHQLERLMDCRAVPEALKARGAHYLVQAARAGEPEAMLRYADGQYWRPDGRGVLSDPGFEAWRREAPGMLQRALESGYPDAAIYLHIAHASDVGFMASLIRDDPEQALAARHLHARLFGRRSPLGHRGLDAAAQQRARELAAQWHRNYFNDRTYLKPLMGHLYSASASPSETPPFCSDAGTQP
ncbi:MAG: hypothetical protein DCF27_05535 [Lysobacteraceae bacterium]|nr:MAG: hypothetical protein DCF27_05535 [Xanthomonadaceae bacterium]